MKELQIQQQKLVLLWMKELQIQQQKLAPNYIDVQVIEDSSKIWQLTGIYVNQDGRTNTKLLIN
jgi:hypothetical protein